MNPTCPTCGAAIERAATGRPRRFCSDACRKGRAPRRCACGAPVTGRGRARLCASCRSESVALECEAFADRYGGADRLDALASSVVTYWDAVLTVSPDPRAVAARRELREWRARLWAAGERVAALQDEAGDVAEVLWAAPAESAEYAAAAADFRRLRAEARRVSGDALRDWAEWSAWFRVGHLRPGARPGSRKAGLYFGPAS